MQQGDGRYKKGGTGFSLSNVFQCAPGMERKHFENIILFLLTFVVAALAGGQSTSDLPVHSTKMVLFGKPRRLALVVVVLKQLS